MTSITNLVYANARPRRRPYSTDTYYVPLANKILKLLTSNYKGKDILNTETLGQIARKTTWYFEDIVADMGIWRSFSEQCKKIYGYDVPLFHDPEDYFADEPSLNAVRYIVWDVVSELHDDISIYPDTGKLHDISLEIFDILNKEFENAPVNDDGKEDIKAVIEHSYEGFDELRESLSWVLSNNYLARNFNYFKDENDAVDNLKEDFFKDLNNSMKRYFVKTSYYFHYKTGPLALLPYQWLADLARVNGMEKEQKALEGIEVLVTDTYHYTKKDDKWLHMESSHGKEFDILTKELNLPENVLESTDGCIGQFIYFKDGWHLNGLLAPHKYGDKFKEIKENVAAQESNVLGTKNILEKTGGKYLLFYGNTREMIDDLIEKKIFAAGQKFPFEDNPNCLRPCVFVDEADPNNNLYFGFNFEEYIKSPDNPYYNEKEAKEDGATMLWERNAPSHFVDWLIDHDLLPDVAESKLFMQNSSAKDKKADMHFMVRYSRRNRL